MSGSTSFLPNGSSRDSTAHAQMHHASGILVTSDDQELPYDGTSGEPGTTAAVSEKHNKLFTVRRVLCGALLLLASVACIGTVVALAVVYTQDVVTVAEECGDGTPCSEPMVQVQCGQWIGTKEGGINVFQVNAIVH